MAPYAGDGYLHYATGLRARLMASRKSDGIVVAWSGCDFDNGSNGFTDASSVTKQYFGYLDSQYAQALKTMNGVLASTSGRVEVVGHSFGGVLTTYVVAACSDDKGRVTETTFNGLGLSRMLQALAAAFYAINIPASKILLRDVWPTTMAALLKENLSWIYLAALAVMVAGTALGVIDTLVRHHTHPHTYSYFHGGCVHTHTHTHGHDHFMPDAGFTAF